MTNDLTAQHLEAISSRIFAEAYTSVANEPSATITGENEAATSCAAITVEWMKGFATFVTNGFHDYAAELTKDMNLKRNQYFSPYHGKIFTIDELINLYFEHLNKKQ